MPAPAIGGGIAVRPMSHGYDRDQWHCSLERRQGHARHRTPDPAHLGSRGHRFTFWTSLAVLGRVFAPPAAHNCIPAYIQLHPLFPSQLGRLHKPLQGPPTGQTLHNCFKHFASSSQGGERVWGVCLSERMWLSLSAESRHDIPGAPYPPPCKVRPHGSWLQQFGVLRGPAWVSR
jgi:hypothetical protein